MVRFSEIINLKEDEEKEPLDPAGKDQNTALNLSDSDILGTSGTFEALSARDAFPAGSQARPEVGRFYERFLQRAAEIKKRVSADQGISPSPILADLHAIINQGLIDDLYDYALSGSDDRDGMLVHTVDLTFASLKVGLGMDYDTKKLLRLGLTAFLENVGMYKIPGSLLQKKGELDQKEIAIIKNHPRVSGEILSRMGDRYQWLAAMAAQTHERLDGSGYPQGLKKEEISETASIVGLVDIYVAMIKNRPYREKFIQTDAIKSIIKASKGLFPPHVVKAFLNQISVFPVNCLVKLNNASIGRVISTDKTQPLKPVIELLYDGRGDRVKDRRVIPLAGNPMLYIVDSVDEKELP